MTNGPARNSSRVGSFRPENQIGRPGMNSRALAWGLAAVVLAASACNKQGSNAGQAPQAQTRDAQKAAGTKTIAAGLAQNGRFMAAAKGAGLDQTLAGPGPYTVFVPDDAAFDAA